MSDRPRSHPLSPAVPKRGIRGGKTARSRGEAFVAYHAASHSHWWAAKAPWDDSILGTRDQWRRGWSDGIFAGTFDMSGDTSIKINLGSHSFEPKITPSSSSSAKRCGQSVRWKASSWIWAGEFSCFLITGAIQRFASSNWLLRPCRCKVLEVWQVEQIGWVGVVVDLASFRKRHCLWLAPSNWYFSRIEIPGLSCWSRYWWTAQVGVWHPRSDCKLVGQSDTVISPQCSITYSISLLSNQHQMSENTSSSLNISSESVEVQAMPGHQHNGSRSASSTPRRNLAVAKPKISSIIRKMPKGHSRNGSGSPAAGPSGLQSLSVSHEQSLRFHDDRVQTWNVGVDPVEHGRLVGEAQHLLEESESKARSLERLAQDIYMRACTQIQHLMTVANELQQTCSRGEPTIQVPHNDLHVVRSQLENQIVLNQLQVTENARLNQENSIGLRTLDHKNSEVSRVMKLVSQHEDVLRGKEAVMVQLQSRCETCEANSAALSASCQRDPLGVMVEQPEGGQNLLSRSMLEAIQALSGRVDWIYWESSEP